MFSKDEVVSTRPAVKDILVSIWRPQLVNYKVLELYLI